MKNQNINTVQTEANDTTKRCIGLLKEVVATQEKVLAFFASEGIDDCKEADTFAESMGKAIQTFIGVLGDSTYHKVMNEKVAI